jgi:hypothetical protein
MNEKEAEIKMTRNWGQDLEGAKEDVAEMTKMLEELKQGGLGIEFETSIQRKCDFCGKILEEGDKFETIGDLDKCDKCKEEGK